MRTLIFLAGLLAALLLFLIMPALRQGANHLRQRFYGWQLRLLANTLGAQMVAGSAVTRSDRPAGHHFTGTFVLDPGNIAAGARELETVAIPGVVIGDVVVVRNRTARALIVTAERVSAADAIEFAIENNTAGALDAGADTYDYAVIRGSTMALR